MSDRSPARRTAWPALVASLVVAGLVACGETVTQVGEGDVVEVRVAPDSTLLGVSRTLQLRAYPVDETVAIISGVEVRWTSGDPSVVSVDDSGLATGVAVGSAQVTAAAAGFTGVVTIMVVPPPELVPSADTVAMAASAGGADPAPDSVTIANGGAFPLTGLAIDSIVYSGGGDAWLTPALRDVTAPATLVLEASIAGLTVAGRYVAVAWLSGVDAAPEPVTVVLDLAPGDAFELRLAEGDSQTVAAGTPVAVAPTVTVVDAFGNGVPGVEVSFTPSGGSGSVTGGSVTSDSAGVARVGSWTLGTVAGANELSAEASGLAAVLFTAAGVPGAATVLEIAAGDGQGAVAGAAVSTPPTVVARDVFGNGVAGVGVVFAVESGGGSIQGAAQTTGSDGLAALDGWTLGTVTGSNTLKALAAAIPDSVVFTADAFSGDAEALEYVAGDAQTDTVGATLATAYAVRVVDAFGNGVSGVTVSWTLRAGGGSIASTSVTGADGVAVASRTLGTTAGANLAEGGVGGLTGSPVAFDAIATPGAPFQLSVVTGTGQSATVGTQVTVAPRVRVRDQFANPIAGHSVTFSVLAGGGAVTPVTPVPTDAQGEAAVSSWTLGTGAGTNNNTLRALADGVGLSGNPFDFSASATPDAPASVTVDPTTDGQTAVTGTNVANQPAVVVVDQYGNPVPSVSVDFAPSGTGSVGTPAATTNASGRATTSWTIQAAGASLQSDGTFPNTLTATVQGTALSTSAGADAIYSYATHVDPLWALSTASGGLSCTGCHGGGAPLGSLSLADTPANNRSALINGALFCDDDGAALPAQYRRVSTAVGVVAEQDYSILMRYIDAAGLGAIGACNYAHPTRSGSALEVVRAWVRNGAPNN